MKETKLNIVDLKKQERIIRMNQVMEMIQKTFDAGRDVDKEKLIAICGLEMGASRRTSLEYIEAAKALMGFAEEKGIFKKQIKKIQSELNISAEK